MNDIIIDKSANTSLLGEQNIPTSPVWIMDQKLVHPEAIVEGSGDEYKSDDISSEQENFSDALNSIESEGETDNVSKNKPDDDILNKEFYAMDADFNEGVDQSSETYYTDKSTNSNLPSAVKNDTLTWPNSDTYSTMPTIGAAQEVYVAHADTESFLCETNGKKSDWSRNEVSNSNMDFTKPWNIEVSNSVDMESTESWKTQLFAGPAEHVGELMSEDESEVIEMSAHHSPPTNRSISIEDPLHQDSTTRMTDMPSFYGEISVTAIQRSGIAADIQNDAQPNESLEISSHDMKSYLPSECIDCSDVRELPRLDKVDSAELLQPHSGTTMILDNKQLHKHSYDSESIGSAVSLTDNFKCTEDSTGNTLKDKKEIEDDLFLDKFASRTVIDPEKLAHSDTAPSLSYSPNISCSRGQFEEDLELIPEASYQDDWDIHENFTALNISSSSKYTDFMNGTCSSDEEPSLENAIQKAGLVGEESSDQDDMESHEHFSLSKNYQDDLNTHEDFTAIKIASSGKETDVMNATCSAVEEPSSENAISKSGLISEELSDEDHVEMHEQFSPPKIASMVTNVMDDTSSGKVTLSDNTVPESGLLSEELSDKDDLNIQELFSPLKTAFLDTEGMDDTSSVEELLADHTVNKSSLLIQELSEKDAGLFMDLDRTWSKLDDGIEQTSPEYSSEKEKASSPKNLLSDLHDNEKEEPFLFSDSISNSSTAPQLMHLKFQAIKEEHVASSTEVDEHFEMDILSKVSGITAKSLGEESNAHSHSSGSNFKWSELHSSSFDRDIPGEFNSEVFALSTSSPEHSASSLASDVSAKPSLPFPNFVFASDKSKLQLSHTKVDELDKSFSLQDHGESPPLPPLPPLQWRTGKSKEKPFLSDAKATQQLIGRSLPPPRAEDPLLLDANATRQLTVTSLPPPLAELETKHESDLAAGNKMDQLFNPSRMPELQSTSLQPCFFEGEMYPSKLSESPAVLDNERCQLTDPSAQRDPSAKSSNESPLEHENIRSVLEDEASDHPARLNREITPLESGGFQSEELPRLELKRIHDSDHGSLNEDIDMIQPEISFTGEGLASNFEDHKEISGDNGAFLKLSEAPPTSVIEIPNPGYLAMMNDDKFTTQYGAMWTAEDGRPNIRPLSVRNWPRNPLIDAVAAHDRNTLRKVSELVQPLDMQKEEERNMLLDQIRNKAFSLKPVAVLRQNIKGPQTNLKVAAILEKANAIRQACAGSDEDDDGDSWSDS